MLSSSIALFCRILKYGKIIPAPLYWRTEVFLRKWRCGSNSERKLWTIFDLADFFLVRAASLFTLRTFGAQINWRVISRMVLFWSASLFVKQIAYSFCGRERKRKYVSQWQTARSKWKWTLIAMVPELWPTTVKILTQLISRYHLPLRWVIEDRACVTHTSSIFMPHFKSNEMVLLCQKNICD